jgi:transcriptional regulator with XRE-family HTH domain
MHNRGVSLEVSPHERVKSWRRLRGYSQERLGELAEMPQSKISRIEAGETTLTADDLETIARALGLSVPEFYGVIDEKAKAS